MSENSVEVWLQDYPSRTIWKVGEEDIGKAVCTFVSCGTNEGVTMSGGQKIVLENAIRQVVQQTVKSGKGPVDVDFVAIAQIVGTWSILSNKSLKRAPHGLYILWGLFFLNIHNITT